jgi:hypothetical protein
MIHFFEGRNFLTSMELKKPDHALSTIGLILKKVMLSGLEGLDRNEGFTAGFLVKANDSVNLGVKGVILTYVYVISGIVTGSPLPNDDIPSQGCLTSENFNAESFRFRLPSVLGTTYTFFVCHDIKF